MGAHLVDAGYVLADRYVAEDLLAQDGDAESWRARDRILSRSVVIQILPSSSQYAAELLSAAKHASRVSDTRVLQVLDAVDDGRLAYVVREWATGQSLDVVLSDGPLPARRATWLLREVASAMANAHKAGLPHRRLVPEAVILTKSSGVKLIGLGTAGALRGDPAAHADLELEDTRDLGRLLFACLTARWPGGARSGLPAAPTEHGRLLRPRQVRAGIPRALDAVCDRILGARSRYGPPITTVAELEDTLNQVLADDRVLATTGASLQLPPTPSAPLRLEPPPGVPPRTGADAAAQVSEPVLPPQHSASSWRRSVVWLVLALLILGAVLLAYLLGQRGSQPALSTSPRSSAPSSQTQSDIGATGRPITVSEVTTLDPVSQGGSGDENPDLAPLAIDGDPRTVWETENYFDNPALGGQKPGVGLVLDLGTPQDVSQVQVTLQGGGSSLELRAAEPDAGEPPSVGGDYTVLDKAADQGTEVALAPDTPVTTQYLLVWFTSLPADDSGYRGRIAEIVVKG